MNSTTKTLAAAAIALLFLAACGSSGNGIGDIFGTGNSGTASSEIRGTVDSVDLSSGSIYLINVSNTNASMLSSGGGSSGNSVRVFYDNRTSVDYNGRSYRPEDLERGDQVSARVDQSNNRLYATSMSVLYDARNSGSTSPASGTNPGTYGSTVHGTVRSVDTNRRTITIDRGYGSQVVVDYSNNTPVYYNGRSYLASDLENGDEIDVRVSNTSSAGRVSAQDITVTRSVNSTSGTNGNPSTIRGTVRSIDTYNHTIQLDSATYTSFNRNTGNSNGSITVQYDPNATVDVQGQLYPVTGLERGDIIDVQVDNLGGSNYIARRIVLVQDVRR